MMITNHDVGYEYLLKMLTLSPKAVTLDQQESMNHHDDKNDDLMNNTII